MCVRQCYDVQESSPHLLLEHDGGTRQYTLNLINVIEEEGKVNKYTGCCTLQTA